jgi:helicase
MGKRVAELYLDPLTAHFIATCMRNASDKKVNSFSFLQMISHTLEIRPMLKVGIREYDKMQEFLLGMSDYLLEQEPSMYEPEYEDFLNSVKTASMLHQWTEEQDEDFLLEEYNTRPGELRAKIDIADWLLYSTEEICKMMHYQPLIKEVIKLRLRLKYGVKEELLPLIRLENIGRVRARLLFRNKMKDINDLKNADLSTLTQIIGEKTALSIKKQLGQEVSKVPENKRKGQISLKDWDN